MNPLNLRRKQIEEMSEDAPWQTRRVHIYLNGVYCFNKQGVRLGGAFSVRWLGEWHHATLEGKRWVLRYQDPAPTPVPDPVDLLD